LFVMLLLTPLVEEVVCRRGLHAWALRHWGRAAPHWLAWPTRANLLVALVFALAHLLRLSPLLALAVVLPSLVVGQIYELTARLWPWVLTHTAFHRCWLGLANHLPA
jgi:membrane protease YdiL (CAAX protease family)